MLETRYEIREPGDGEQVLRLCRSTEMDAVLLGIQRSDITGLAVLAQLCVELPTLPVVVVVPAAGAWKVVAAMKLGAADCLTEPFARQDLLETIENAI